MIYEAIKKIIETATNVEYSYMLHLQGDIDI